MTKQERENRPLEKVIEQYFRDKCRANGFLCYKFTSPANSGVPDRLVIGHGLTFFVELKRPGEKPRQLQIKRIQEMRDHGAVVYVIDTKEKADRLISVMLAAVGIDNIKTVKTERDKAHVTECIGSIENMTIIKRTIEDF